MRRTRRQHVAGLLGLVTGCGSRDAMSREDARYGDQPGQVATVLRPAAGRGSGTGVVFYHGGGWVADSPAEVEQAFCGPLVALGCVVANCGYRLGPEFPAPAAVLDARRAAAWAREHQAHLGIRPGRLVTAGNSAGAHLALMVAMASADDALGPVTPVAAVIDIYGIADVWDVAQGANRRTFADQWLPRGPEREALARRLSPLSLVRPGLPPVLCVHGDRDDVVPYGHSTRLVDALRRAGNDAELQTVAGGEHGFRLAAWEQVWRRVGSFLRARSL